MVDYAICEVKGKQLKLVPDQQVLVDWVSDGKDLSVNVLMLSEAGKLKIGKPFLKEKITLKNVGEDKGKKIRVAKFHAKANYRKVTGSRAKKTKLIYGA